MVQLLIGKNIKSTTTGTISGCIVWIIGFGAISSCVLPMAMLICGFTSAGNFAMRTVGPIICPAGSTAESYSYATTTTDEFGNSQPNTDYELHYIDASGAIVKEDPILYAFLWIGIIALLGWSSPPCWHLHYPRLRGS